MWDTRRKNNGERTEQRLETAVVNVIIEQYDVSYCFLERRALKLLALSE